MPLRFTLRQLEYLTAVGAAGTIAQAALRLNVSSPSISTAIAQIEAEFGFPIFVRKHAQGMSPTDGGRQLLIQAAALIDAAHRLNDLANDITGRIRGPFRVGCLLTFAQIVLPRLRRAYVDRFPESDFIQSEAHQSALIEGLRTATIDIALTYDLSVPTDLEFVELLSLPPYALLADDHPLGQCASVSARDLAPYPMVLLDLPLSADYFLSFFTEAGVQPRIVERTRDMAIMQSLVANGFGYSIANIRPATDLSPDGRRLRILPMTGPVRPMRMGLLHSGGGGALPKVQAFGQLCKEMLSAQSLTGMGLGASGLARA